jgi:hypothetical protein
METLLEINAESQSPGAKPAAKRGKKEGHQPPMDPRASSPTHVPAADGAPRSRGAARRTGQPAPPPLPVTDTAPTPTHGLRGRASVASAQGVAPTDGRPPKRGRKDAVVEETSAAVANAPPRKSPPSEPQEKCHPAGAPAPMPAQTPADGPAEKRARRGAVISGTPSHAGALVPSTRSGSQAALLPAQRTSQKSGPTAAMGKNRGKEASLPDPQNGTLAATKGKRGGTDASVPDQAPSADDARATPLKRKRDVAQGPTLGEGEPAVPGAVRGKRGGPSGGSAKTGRQSGGKAAATTTPVGGPARTPTDAAAPSDGGRKTRGQKVEGVDGGGAGLGVGAPGPNSTPPKKGGKDAKTAEVGSTDP